MSAQVERDGSVVLDGERIGRVRPVGSRWTWVADGVSAPCTYPSRRIAVSALTRFHNEQVQERAS